MSYVDGFVAAVPTANKDIYRRHAEEVAEIFKTHGALSFVECWGDDVPDGEVTSFPMAVQCGEDETACFSWVVWPSKAVRYEATPKIMEAARRMFETNPMPFDGKRMIYGGFEIFVDA